MEKPNLKNVIDKMSNVVKDTERLNKSVEDLGKHVSELDALLYGKKGLNLKINRYKYKGDQLLSPKLIGELIEDLEERKIK